MTWVGKSGLHSLMGPPGQRLLSGIDLSDTVESRIKSNVAKYRVEKSLDF
jgi:hypothetical protein